MKTPIYILYIILIFLTTACSQETPQISHIVVKSDRLGVLLDTENRAELDILENIFHEKIEKPNGGPEFRYLIDITIADKTTRWQYSDDGFIRNYEETQSMIYQLKDVVEFNRIVKLR